MSAMLLPFRARLLVILVAIVTCRPVNKRSISTLPLQSAASPQQAIETKPQKPTQAQPIQKQWSNTLTFRTHSISESHDGYCPYELSAEYPAAVSKNVAVRRFNKWIKRKILDDVKRFRRLELRAEPRARRERRKSITEALELTFEIYFSNRQLITFRLTHRVMAAGQMHPINYYETINYDLPKHRPLIARDVFRRGYLKVFSTYSRIYLRETYEISNDDWFNGGTAARRRNFGNWNLVPDGVLISFEDYQVSSHNFGQPELIVPYSRLRRVLRSSVTRHYIKP